MSTLREKIDDLVRRSVRALGVMFVHEYRVVDQTNDLIDLQVFVSSDDLPDAPRTVGRPFAGCSILYSLGTPVLVGFVAGDPARPFIAHGPESGSSTPQAVSINATTKVVVGKDASDIEIGGTGPKAARVGDFVVRLGLNAGVPSYSTSATAPYAWMPIPAGTGPAGALLPTDAGIAVDIVTGSSRTEIA